MARKLRIAWLVGLLVIAMALLMMREYTYPRFEKFVLPSASMLVICAAVPWLGSRFSLRTLLIATTLVALALGLIVWAAR